MKSTILLCSFILYILCLAHGEQQWSGQKWLDKNYSLKWKTDDIDKEVVFKLEVMTKGWISFGLSKHGKQTEADLAIAWIEHGHIFIKDFWINQYGTRSTDNSQDWHLLSASENTTHTIIDLRRKYVTCDPSDLEIFDNEYEVSNIVFAYGSEDPDGYENTYDPTVQGVVHLSLFKPEHPFEPPEDDVQEINYWLNVQFQHAHEHLNIQHHVHSFYCAKGSEPLEKYEGVLYPCYDYKHPLHFLRKRCYSFMLSTSILSEEPTIYPDNSGLVIDQDDSSFMLLEIHLINPYDYKYNVSVVLKTWITKHIREYDVGYRVFGAAPGSLEVNWGFIVPSLQPSFKVTVTSDSYCLESSVFDENGIFIFAIGFHSHHGKSIEIRQYRNDSLLRALRYHHYDYEYQPYRRLKDFIHFLRDDKLVIICEYNSMDSTKSYTGPREHCIALTIYYPKIKSLSHHAEGSISGITQQNMLTITGLQSIEGYDQTKDKAIIRDPGQFNGTLLNDFIEENNYQMKDPELLAKFMASHQYQQFCGMEGFKEQSKSIVWPPPGLYQSISSERAQNSCPVGYESKKWGNQNVQDINLLKKSLNKIRLSFKFTHFDHALLLNYESN